MPNETENDARSGTPQALADPIRVLLLDDQIDNLLLRSTILRKYGYLTETASSIEEAESLLDQIDIAVLDYHLGAGQFGTEVASRLREQRPEVPIIILSATLEHRFGGVEDMHLLKGYSSVDDLVTALRSFEAKRRGKPVVVDARDFFYSRINMAMGDDVVLEILDGDGNWQYVNDVCARLLERPRDWFPAAICSTRCPSSLPIGARFCAPSLKSARHTSTAPTADYSTCPARVKSGSGTSSLFQSLCTPAPPESSSPLASWNEKPCCKRKTSCKCKELQPLFRAQLPLQSGVTGRHRWRQPVCNENFCCNRLPMFRAQQRPARGGLAVCTAMLRSKVEWSRRCVRSDSRAHLQSSCARIPAASFAASPSDLLTATLLLQRPVLLLREHFYLDRWPEVRPGYGTTN